MTGRQVGLPQRGCIMFSPHSGSLGHVCGATGNTGWCAPSPQWSGFSGVRVLARWPERMCSRARECVHWCLCVPMRMYVRVCLNVCALVTVSTACSSAHVVAPPIHIRPRYVRRRRRRRRGVHTFPACVRACAECALFDGGTQRTRLGCALLPIAQWCTATAATAAALATVLPPLPPRLYGVWRHVHARVSVCACSSVSA